MRTSSARVEILEARIAPALTNPAVNLAPGGDFALVFRGDAGDQAGAAVSAAGDVNGDGFDDLLVGSYATGTTFVVFGRAGGFSIDNNLRGLAADEGFQITGGVNPGGLHAAGDVNGDGFDDILVSSGTSAHVIFGHAGAFAPVLTLASLDGRNGFTITDAGTFANQAGDVNGDGFADVIVGDPSVGINASGAAFIIFGKRSGFAPTIAAFPLASGVGVTIFGAAFGDGAGSAVSGAGDVNGDGLDDVIIGATGADNNGGNAQGAAFVVFGSRTLPDAIQLSTLGTAGFVIQGVADLDTAGSAVSAAGDVNGDGFADVIVGANGVAQVVNGSDAKGAVYVVFGRAGSAPVALSTLDGTNGFKLAGLAAGDRLGGTVSGLGDVNLDGFDDVAFGTPFAASGAGAAYVIYGGAGGFATPPDLAALTVTQGFKIFTDTAGDRIGGVVSVAGDLTNDGYPDLLVSGDSVDTDKGAAFVVPGTPNGFRLQPTTFSPDGKTATFTDIDGDIVTVKVSNTTASLQTDAVFVLLSKPGTTGSPAQFLELGLNAPFDGADLSITAKRAGGGDGKVNLGRLQAFAADLGAVTIGGDLANLSVGDNNPDLGLKSLTVGSLGAFGHATLDSFFPLEFRVAGGMGALNVAGDVKEVAISVIRATGAATGGDIASVTIGGSVIGGLQTDSGKISAFDQLGPVKIGGDVRGGAGDLSASISASRLATVTIAGAVLGGAGDFSGAIFSASPGGFGNVTIGKSLVGGVGLQSGSISAFENLSNVAIGRSMLGGAGEKSGSILASGNIGKVSIKRDLVGGAGIDSGIITTGNLLSSGSIASVTIGGDARSGAGVGAGGIFAGITLGAVSIKGDVVGTAGTPFVLSGQGPLTGTKSVAIVSVKVGGDFERALVLGGYPPGGTGSNGHSQVGAITVGGDWIASTAVSGVLSDFAPPSFTGVFGNGDDVHTDVVSNLPDALLASITSVTIKGAARGTFAENDRFAIESEVVGSVSVGGVKLALTKGAGNDLAAIRVGATPDFVVREVSRTTGQPADPVVALPAAGPRSAVPAQVNLSTLPFADGFTITGAGANDLSGFSVSDAGDVNGDGVGDLLIGATQVQANNVKRGAAYVVFGQSGGFGPTLALADLDGFNGFKIAAAGDDDSAGFSVSAAGDVNGDGFADVIVGAPFADDGGLFSGAAYVVFGKADSFDPVVSLGALDGTNGFTLPGLASDNRAGRSVSGAGDVNGDGFDDLLIGAYRAAEGGTQRGAAYVVFGQAGGFGASVDLAGLDGGNGFRLSGVDDVDFAGRAVSGAGDFDGDGFDDLIVGAHRAAEGGTFRGAAYVIFGKKDGFDPVLALADLDGRNGIKISGAEDSDLAGYSVSAAGDVNGDGLSDVVIGAVGADVSGAAYVIFGKATFNFNEPVELADINNGLEGIGFKLTGEDAGRSVGAAGDVNGDGYADLLLGAPFAAEGGTQRGTAYVLYGKPGGFATTTPLTLDGSNGFKLAGLNDKDKLGASVSGAGDVNGDGYDDIIVGAPNVGNDGSVLAFITGAGASYVIYGGPSGEFIDPTISADGFTATWTDVDGDAVTLKISGVTQKLTEANFKLLAKSTADSRAQLHELALGAAGFSGASVSLTAKRAPGGDGKVNMGFLNASDRDLGAVTIGGDLARIAAGDTDDGLALASLTVGSLGVFGGRTQNTGGSVFSEIIGSIGPVKITGDLREASLDVRNTAGVGTGRIASLTVGGSFVGNTPGTGSVFAAGSLGPVKIGGDIVGGGGINSGILAANGIASVTLGGSLLGGAGDGTGRIQSDGTVGVSAIGDVKIGSDLRGGDGARSGQIFARANIGKISITGDQLGGAGALSGIINAFDAGAKIASVTIGGDARSGTGANSGGLISNGSIGPVVIKGDVLGNAAVAYTIITPGPLTGTRSLALASLTVGGDFERARVLAGIDADFDDVNGHAQIGAISIGGDWIASSISAGLVDRNGGSAFLGAGGETFINGGPVNVIASIASITIKGRAIGTFGGTDRFGIVAERIGSVTLGGVKLALTGNPDTIAPGPTPDFFVREVARI